MFRTILLKFYWNSIEKQKKTEHKWAVPTLYAQDMEILMKYLTNFKSVQNNASREKNNKKPNFFLGFSCKF